MNTLHCPRCGQVMPTSSTDETCAACAERNLATTPPSPARTASLLDSAAMVPPVAGEQWSEGDDRAPPGYAILEELGRGGMGVVYKARQTALGRIVALKMILSGSHAGEGELARFQTEAEAVARVQHPGIVQIFEVGVHQGRPFLSLEFCDGGSLEKKLGGTPIQPGEAAALVEQLARAVQAAHQAQVAHRDLKPANVLLQGGPDSPRPDSERVSESRDHVAKITDFGLAKKLDQQGQTVTGQVMGTPSYMAPEQAEGEKTVGPPADVYALGAILYECVTGRPPFKAATLMDTLMQVVADDPVPARQLNASVPRDLETICLKCLQKDLGKRYTSAAELADDLGRFQRREPIRARPVSATERAVKWVRRNPVVSALTAAVVVVTLLGLGVTTGLYFHANRLAEDRGIALNGARAAEEKTSQALREARAAEAKARKALDDLEVNMIEDVLRHIGQPTQDEALGRLTNSSEDTSIRLRFLQMGLDKPGGAQLLGFQANTIVQALVGAHPRCRQPLAEMIRARIKQLVHEQLNRPTSQHQERVACLNLGVALGLQEDEMANEVLALFVREVQKGGDQSLLMDRCGITAVFERHSRYNPDAFLPYANQVAQALLATMANQTDETVLLLAAQQLSRLQLRLGRKEAGEYSDLAALILLATLAKTTNESATSTLQLALALMSRSGGEKRATETVKALLPAVRKAEKSHLMPIAYALQRQAQWLEEKQADEAAQAILVVMAKTSNPSELVSMERAVVALSQRLEPQLKTEYAHHVALTLVTAADELSNPYMQQQFSRAFYTVSTPCLVAALKVARHNSVQSIVLKALSARLRRSFRDVRDVLDFAARNHVPVDLNPAWERN